MLGNIWSRMAELMLSLRRQVAEHLDEPGARRAAFRDLATEEALSVLDTRGVQGVVQWLIERHFKPTHG